MSPMPLRIEALLKNGSKTWNQLRQEGKTAEDYTGATFVQLFSANTNLAELCLAGSEWEACDLSRVSFRNADLSNAYFHGGRLQDCDFRNAQLEGATFENLKLVRCNFSGAKGLKALELIAVDMDYVVGLEELEEKEEEENVGTRASSGVENSEETPLAFAQNFRPFDSPEQLFQKGLRRLEQIPLWVLDVHELGPPLPLQTFIALGPEGLLRDLAKAKLSHQKPTLTETGLQRAKNALAQNSADVACAIACAIVYLHHAGAEFSCDEAALRTLHNAFQETIELDDLTGAVDPRLVHALKLAKAEQTLLNSLDELRIRLSAAQLFTALLQAKLPPEHAHWKEAVENDETATSLCKMASGGDLDFLEEAFHVFAGLPEEIQLQRLAYLAVSNQMVEELLNKR
ncbi:MAG: pentapeptide repeat-containing protein [Cystobacterineae bacterium]|nr:pentapeptide repeat-containing protein [Cystobacterineae bacterium]